VDTFSCGICYHEGKEHLHEGHEAFTAHVLGHLEEFTDWCDVAMKYVPKPIDKTLSVLSGWTVSATADVVTLTPATLGKAHITGNVFEVGDIDRVTGVVRIELIDG
jgi:hypothetical protein